MENDFDNKELPRIANHLMLHGSFINQTGLLGGKMGIILFFYHYSRYTGIAVYDDFAGELIDEVCNEINTQTSFHFDDGLCGIGWGMIHLIKNGFIEADTDNWLSGIDECIMDRDVRRMKDTSLYTGLAGIAHYAVQRKNMDKMFLAELLQSMEYQKNTNDDFENLKNCLKQIILQNRSVSSTSTELLLKRIVNKEVSNTKIVDVMSKGLGIERNGLSGIGLKLMEGEYGWKS
jgi:hypothetical protein